MTAKDIVKELDRYIVGQDQAKRLMAIALVNRDLRTQLPDDLRVNVTPKNILLVGSTGVGKTEIARRMATLVAAPFIKTEITKYTQVGYVGKDVDSMIRDLLNVSLDIIEEKYRRELSPKIKKEVDKHIAKTIGGSKISPTICKVMEVDWRTTEDPLSFTEYSKLVLDSLKKGMFEETVIKISVSKPDKSEFDPDEGFDPRALFMIDSQPLSELEVPVKEARLLLAAQFFYSHISRMQIYKEAIQLTEEKGIIFIDEVDKICGARSTKNELDVSRVGVQRDLIPLVEGVKVPSKYGWVKTDFILFVAAGAFFTSKPSDLLPELQGRFPIRVMLENLQPADYENIMEQPVYSLIKQYQEIFRLKGIDLQFDQAAIKELARLADHINKFGDNTGARRLNTFFEHILEEAFYNIDSLPPTYTVYVDYVIQKLTPIVGNQQLTTFLT